MDDAAASRIAHGALALMNPMSDVATDEALDLLDLAPGSRVLEVACGRAELLRRIAARWEVAAQGYDADADTIAEARRRSPELELRVADTPPLGPFDLVVCVASSHALGGFPEALSKLRGLVRDGGQVLLGEGYWMREPSPAYLQALGGASADELSGYDGLMREAQHAGLTPLYASVAGPGDWDRYEWRLILNAERWAAAHPEDPGAGVLRERAERARARLMLFEGRTTLGFALVLLRRS
jgi:SAM-dependent methyltransferase